MSGTRVLTYGEDRDALTSFERKDYIRSVQCLQSSPALTPSALGSGIKTRFDDFVATHMNQSMTIHYSGTFLSWHRYFVHLYEQTLIDECGYNGTLPVRQPSFLP